MQYIIYTDESEKKGRYFGNFYGGTLIRSTDFDYINKELNKKREELNLTGEIKWQKVTENYLEKYMDIINLFFDFVKEDKVKIRIMFTHNMYQAVGLNEAQKGNEYFLLYYQFFKHIFGFQYSNPTNEPISLYILLDQLPDKKEKNEEFKKFIYSLQYQEIFVESKLHFKSMDDIGEATSHEHIILQCLDVVLGSMEFKLNGKDQDKPPGQRLRGKRTRAKEKLYKLINKRIREIYPNFNIGATTGCSDLSDRWSHPYRHWKFEPKYTKVNTQYNSKNK
ncbi:DUF3800 domain-containing protein [Paenibacillus sp. MMS20-IR301]|uniref:DUF3800 domain-containing protein n=1 Tax=Paenibacillus sp. MMS20-IR301 TaxID=2895946 RepID=UPI0028E3485B|nr:DUF3800 domain-containing protein [Paenibacillus sp. MMS20-IR301]WNS41784.1 DUF3800 domain-containing protein [Paenibacillus sp. MMS20-IR301]